MAAILCASCAGTSPGESARQAFEDWRLALLAGDADKTYRMMSEGLKAQWLFDLLTMGDPGAMEWRRNLPDVADADGVKRSLRTYLDLWLENQRERRPPRAAPLHPMISAHPSLFELYRRYFLQELAVVRQKFSGLRIAEVYTDQTGASVAVRTAEGTTDLFQLVYEGEGWKIDHHRSALRTLPR